MVERSPGGGTASSLPVNRTKHTTEQSWIGHRNWSVQTRGGSRTSPGRGRQSLGEGGRQPNILVIFSEKPYEIKEILVRRGRARAGGAPPPPNPPLQTIQKFET